MTTMQPLSYMLYSFLYIYEWLSLCSCITFCIIILNFSLCVCVGLPCTSYYIQHTHIQSHFDCVSINAVHRSWKQTFFLLWLLPRCPLASISFTPSSLSLSLSLSLSPTLSFSHTHNHFPRFLDQNNEHRHFLNMKQKLAFNTPYVRR